MTINHTRYKVHMDHPGASQSSPHHFFHHRLQPHYLTFSYPSFDEQYIHIYLILNLLRGV